LFSTSTPSQRYQMELSIGLWLWSLWPLCPLYTSQNLSFRLLRSPPHLMQNGSLSGGYTVTLCT
jgi:hypothetical protein